MAFSTILTTGARFEQNTTCIVIKNNVLVLNENKQPAGDTWLLLWQKWFHTRQIRFLIINISIYNSTVFYGQLENHSSRQTNDVIILCHRYEVKLFISAVCPFERVMKIHNVPIRLHLPNPSTLVSLTDFLNVQSVLNMFIKFRTIF